MQNTPDRPGLVPHPTTAPVTGNTSVRIPDAPSPAMPRTKAPASKAPAKKTTPTSDLWSFSFEGMPGGELDAVAFTPIDLPEPRPLVVQFYQDTTRRASIDVIPQPPNTTEVTWWAQPHDGTPTAGTIQLDPVADPTTVTELRVSVTDNFNAVWPAGVLASTSHVRMEWEGPSGTNVVRYNFGSGQLVDDTPDYYRLFVSINSFSPGTLDPIETDPGDPTQVKLVFESPQDPLELRPNVVIRARITYSAGKASQTMFECDWAGALAVFANQLTLERVAVIADPEFVYHPQSVKVNALVHGNPDARPESLPTLTEPTIAVSPDSTVSVVKPPLARRVSLTTLYGDEGAPGDAPLGQFFVAFVASTDHAIAYIDAMSAREALFGAGMPIPAGTRAVALTNKSADASVRLGLVWHLGV